MLINHTEGPVTDPSDNTGLADVTPRLIYSLFLRIKIN